MESASKFNIDGKRVDPVSEATDDLIDPANEAVHATIAMGNAEDIGKAGAFLHTAGMPSIIL